ncbi:MAG: type IV secretory system conjugative DNA transfer family protein [Solirubrobacterales bacterium]
MGTVIGFIILIALCVILYRLLLRPIVRFFRRDRWERAEEEETRKWLESLGPSHEERMAAIAAAFEAGTATVTATCCLRWQRKEDDAELQSRQNAQTDKSRRLKARTLDVGVIFSVSRNLAGMGNRERTYLKVLEELNSVAEGEEKRFRVWRAALLWGDGKGVANAKWQNLRDSERDNAVPVALQKLHLSTDQVLNKLQQYAADALAKPDLDPRRRAILGELTQAIAPGAGGGAWLGSGEVGASPYAEQGAYGLHIGSFEDGQPLTYTGEGSMVTIAPPGSGKTQCNVFPNLLSWPGPAVVLDISGDIYEHTAAWRAANVGPVYKFSPLEPEESHKYNPLTFVRSEPDYIWEDSRLLAEMMIVPSLSADPFWENEARTLLTAAIAHVCYSNPPEQRPMHAVLDILFGGEAWNQMIVGLRMAVDVRVMTQHATSLSAMNEKTLNSVLQTARSSLSAWTGERVARATERSDWNPLDLRGGAKPTIYIYIRPNEVDSYLSLLRVFIGQHIRVLTGGAVPPREAPPILVMLDELPRLRYMAPIDEGLSIGRKYGLRLWMFAQSVGQFKTAYENADGLLGSCAVRVFMNPGGADGLAEQISEELGYVDSVNDGTRRRLVEAAELSGPGYQDLEIVFSTGGKPAKVKKDFAYRNPELAQRMEMR